MYAHTAIKMWLVCV